MQLFRLRAGLLSQSQEVAATDDTTLVPKCKMSCCIQVQLRASKAECLQEDGAVHGRFPWDVCMQKLKEQVYLFSAILTGAHVPSSSWEALLL